MLKKKPGLEAIEKSWSRYNKLENYYKISSPLIIPEGCYKIAPWTFFGCIKLKKVVIPEGCEKIGDRTFFGCVKLKEVVIPGSVNWIGQDAFVNCREATIIFKRCKKGIKGIRNCALSHCKYVKEEIRN